MCPWVQGDDRKKRMFDIFKKLFEDPMAFSKGVDRIRKVQGMYNIRISCAFHVDSMYTDSLIDCILTLSINMIPHQFYQQSRLIIGKSPMRISRGPNDG